MPNENNTDLIQIKNIVKVYPPSVVALDGVTVSFRKGEIHAVVGENGAGKSTLMKALYGLIPFDKGDILYQGQPVHFHSTGEAIAAGIGMVHQEILLIPEYTVWENIVLGMEPAGLFDHLDTKAARRRVKAKVDEFQFNLDVNALVEDISIAARQKVEILKLLYRNVSVLILDEPTAVLTPQEIPQLFSELNRLRDSGRTILFISHRLDEVLDLSDRTTVMRRGKKIDTVETNKTTREDLARMMVGRDVIFTSRRTPQIPGEVALDIQELTVTDENKRVRLDHINLQVRAGEIVGVAGVEGNGQYELVNSIIGLVKPTSGSIKVNNENISEADILTRRKLVSFVPQDRGRMGASLDAPVLENAIMTHHRLDERFSWWNRLWLNYGFARKFTEKMRQDFSINLPSINSPIRSLSGGNQQKLVLGRELMLSSPFILLDQPTRGLDVGSIEYVHNLVLRMRSEQRAILLVSADLEELFLLADRIIVLFRGKLYGNLPVEETNIEEIGLIMLQGKRADGA